jgi:hypothetical protein
MDSLEELRKKLQEHKVRAAAPHPTLHAQTIRGAVPSLMGSASRPRFVGTDASGWAGHHRRRFARAAPRPAHARTCSRINSPRSTSSSVCHRAMRTSSSCATTSSRSSRLRRSWPVRAPPIATAPLTSAATGASASAAPAATEKKEAPQYEWKARRRRCACERWVRSHAGGARRWASAAKPPTTTAFCTLRA